MSSCALLRHWWLQPAWPAPASSSTCPPRGPPVCSSWPATRGTAWSPVWRSCSRTYHSCTEASPEPSQLNVSPWFPACMTATWRRPANRRASSSSSLCRPRLPFTGQARQPMWPSSCSALEDSTPRRLRSRAWPPTPDHRPTSPACRVPASASTAALRPSQPPWSPNPAYLAGPTKSVCTTAAQLPASTDDLSRCCQFFSQEMYFFLFVPPDQSAPRASAVLI